LTFATGTPISNTMVEMYTLCAAAHNVYYVAKALMLCLVGNGLQLTGFARSGRHITSRMTILCISPEPLSVPKSSI